MSEQMSNQAASGAVDVPAWHGEHLQSGQADEKPEKPYRVFVYHHTHWDREWWATMQDFRLRLVELIDELMDTLEADPAFRCFLLDGQTIVLKDYLEVRPEQQERLLGLIRSGRIQCGPWYILPDEFLVGAEAHIRNLWLGERVARRLGFTNEKVGYIPDTFGHISQMPQILRGFGIDNAMVWRGLGGPQESFKSEFLWESPDGSQVFTYWFPDGYYVVDFLHFDNPVKTYDETYGRVRRSLERWKHRATTDCLLMPYGGDHRLIDPRLPRLLGQVNDDLRGFAELRWATTREFLDAVRAEQPQLDVIRGELRQTGADLPHLLPGVLSARLYLKRLNFRGQQALERYAEPFSALAWRAGRKVEANLLWTAWELLVQNHPHDSICGCSIDQVHREMLPRFEQSHQIAELLTAKSVQHLDAQLDTSRLGDGELALVVRNSLEWTRTGTAGVWLLRGQPDVHPRTHALLDENGAEVPFQVRDVEAMRPMTDKTRYTELAFSAEDVPGFGHRVYRLARREKVNDPKQVYFTALQPSAKLKGSEPLTDLAIGGTALENRFFRVEVSSANGTLSVLDKRSGERYDGLNAFEDGGDVGDTYNYSAPLGDAVIRTNERPPLGVRITIEEAGHARATLRVDLDLELPARLTDDRLSRSAETVTQRVSTFVTLRAGEPRIDVRVEWDNRVCDHRLRALFPLGAPALVSHAEGHFDVIERPTSVADEGNGWPEPFVRELPQTGYASVHHGSRGLTVANKGLPEFELLADGQGTLAVTLLRSVGWLSREDLLSRVGGAGPDTLQPDAMCLGPGAAEYAIIPHPGSWLEAKAYREAHAFLAPLHASHTGKHKGSKTAWTEEGVRLEGDHTLLLSACKKAEDEEALVLRFWNVAKRPTSAVLHLAEKPASVVRVGLDERPLADGKLTVRVDGGFALEAGPAEIVTLAIRF